MPKDGFDQQGQVIFGPQQNADRIVNEIKVRVPSGPLLVKVESREQPPLAAKMISLGSYCLKFSVEHPNKSISIHRIECLFNPLRVQVRVDGLIAHNRPVISLKRMESDYSRIPDVPIRFVSRRLHVRVVDIVIFDHLAWRIMHT